MKILVNTSNLKKGGGLQVAHSFLNEIKSNTEHIFHIVLSLALREQINPQDYPENFTFYNYSINPTLLKAIAGRDSFLNSLEEKIQPDKVFSVFGPTYWRPKRIHVTGFAKAQYLYKNSPFFDLLSTKDRIKLKIKQVLHLNNFNKCSDVLITESEDVTKQLQKIFLNKKIHTVTNYYNQMFDMPDYWDNSIKLPEFNGLTILTVSANYPHKNLSIIPQVISYLKENHPKFRFRFILTINGGDIAYDDSQKENIVFLGKINITQCPFVYKQSDFMFLPTLLECFSASYAEAMRMETPILTSDLSFAHGLCGNSAIYFNPLSPSDIGEKIVKLAKSEDKQTKLVENGKQQLKKFDNSTVRALKYLKIMEELKT
ncbi:glycosyltransferase [Mariniphaga sp.]|uniref:glycosyltransferase n=1 Tax=Mariniphaga sp. TaxID=1954475 RepID=UPI0035648A55